MEMPFLFSVRTLTAACILYLSLLDPSPSLPAVIWRNAVDSLTAAHKYYLYTPAPGSPEMADIVANDLLTP